MSFVVVVEDGKIANAHISLLTNKDLGHYEMRHSPVPHYFKPTYPGSDAFFYVLEADSFAMAAMNVEYILTAERAI